MAGAIMKKILISLIASLSLFSSNALFAEETISTTVTKSTKDTPVTAPAGAQGTTTTTTTTTTVSTNDTAIVSAIYADFAKSAALIGTNLSVNSQDGVVTVSGNVTEQAQADEALNIARSAAGVKEVRSSISVMTNPPTNNTMAPRY